MTNCSKKPWRCDDGPIGCGRGWMLGSAKVDRIKWWSRSSSSTLHGGGLSLTRSTVVWRSAHSPSPPRQLWSLNLWMGAAEGSLKSLKVFGKSFKRLIWITMKTVTKTFIRSSSFEELPVFCWLIFSSEKSLMTWGDPFWNILSHTLWLLGNECWISFKPKIIIFEASIVHLSRIFKATRRMLYILHLILIEHILHKCRNIHYLYEKLMTLLRR